MNLNREDPAHIALIELALAAAQLVEDLHDYQHFMGGRDDWPFSLSQIEKHYEQVTLAWERFRSTAYEERRAELPATGERPEPNPTREN